MSTLGWLASVSSSVFVMTSLIEAIIDVSNADYLFKAWQYTLIMLAFLIITIFFNTWGAKTLPKLEVLSLFGHLGGFFVVMIPLLVMAPKNSGKAVFTEVVNSSGWKSTGTSCLIAQVTVMYCNLGKFNHSTLYFLESSLFLIIGTGSDSAVHISEEVENASINVPRAMWWSYILNLTMGISMLVVMLFCIGPLDGVLEAQSPYLALFKNTGSDATATALLVILFLLISLGNITALATTSREMWAFSRDKGFPFSRWISEVSIDTFSCPSHVTKLTYNLDEPQTSSPRQLRLPYIRHRWHPVPHQPRLHLRLQHHCFSYSPCPPLHLHDLHWLRSPQETPRRTSPTSSLVSWSFRHPDQHVCVLLLRICDGVCVFPS